MDPSGITSSIGSSSGVPASLSAKEEAEWVESMVARLEKQERRLRPSDEFVAGNLDVDLQRRDRVRALHLHGQLLRIELDVTRDGGKQFVAQDGDEIARPKRDALMGKQDLKPLTGDRRAAARFKESEEIHAALRLNRRVKKVFFSSGIATGAAVSPPRRRAASR